MVESLDDHVAPVAFKSSKVLLRSEGLLVVHGTRKRVVSKDPWECFKLFNSLADEWFPFIFESR